MGKVTLRLAQLSDADFLYATMRDDDYNKYFPSNLISKSLTDQRKKLRQFRAQAKKALGYYFIITYGNEKAGFIDLHKVDAKNKRAAIGYGLAKKFRGKGIVTIATKLVLQYSKHKLKLHGISAYINTKNKLSKKVLIRCGFKKIGIINDYDFEKGSFIDMALYWKIL